MVFVSTATAEREPGNWLEDMSWHRRMFRQSHFRWVPEDPMAIALYWTNGRVLHETPAHLRTLDRQRHELHAFASGIDDAMIAPLAEAERRCSPQDYRRGLELVGLSQHDVRLLRFFAPRDVPPHREARRALRGIPLPNPFSQIWELRQMRSMYRAAEDILLDVYCDLILELAPDHGWHNLAQLLQDNRSEPALRDFVDDQRRHRGGPGDPRREPLQRYDKA